MRLAAQGWWSAAGGEYRAAPDPNARYWKVQFTSVKLPLGDERGSDFDELLLALCEWRCHRTLGAAESSAACAECRVQSAECRVPDDG